MQKLTPFIWYESDAIGAARYYRSIFGEKNVAIHDEDSFNTESSGPVQVVTVEMFGTQMRLMSAGPHQQYTDMVSFEVMCDDQAEVDAYWDGLIVDGGSPVQCGWCKDKYGISWQIIPKRFRELASDPDQEKSGRVMQAMMGMQKLIVSELEAAYNG